MRTLKLALLLTCTLSTLFLFAQKDPIKWGKIPADDLAMTSYEQDPSAGAVVLCDYGQIYFNISLQGTEYNFKRHKRIKILKRSGFDQANIEIPFLEGQDISKLKAHIYSPDGSVTELGKKDFFDEETTKFYRKKKFAFPNVKEGSVIEFSYIIESTNLVSLRNWYFQEYIPVRWSELRFSELGWFTYSTVQTGFQVLKIIERETGSKTLLDYPVKTFESRWAAEHVPAMKSEPYTACFDDYRSKIQFQLKSIQLPFSYTEPFFKDWGEIAGALFKNPHFGRQYLKKGENKKLLEAAAPAMAAAPTKLEKAIAAYDFVNGQITWNGTYYHFSDEDLNKAFEKKSAYSGEMNLMVLALLKKAGIRAFPVLVSTRSNGKVNKYYPMLGQFNHTLVWAEIDGKEYWIDAGDKMRPFGTPAMQSLNFEGILIDDEKKTYQWVGIKPAKTKDVMLVNASVNEDGELTADLTCSHTGYSALKERSACAGKDGKQHWQNRLDGQHPDAVIETINLQNQTAPNKALKNKMALDIPGAAMANGDMLYLSPTIYSQFAENPFKVEERTLPIEFPYPQTEQVITNLTLPEGYAVEELPESVKLSLPEAAGSFSYRVSEINGKVQIISKVVMKKTFFLPEEYAALRNFFSMVEEKQAEQVVLKKQT
ncbi:MAG TPA: DUF3857 domain-containing protein [Bacteroidetes bacterium]|nr:DUF3857 domain-containing protein [Bacteroidota bacterium]